MSVAVEADDKKLGACLLFIISYESFLAKCNHCPIRSFRLKYHDNNLLLSISCFIIALSVSIATEPPPGLNPQYWMDSDASTFRVRGKCTEKVFCLSLIWIVFYSCFVHTQQSVVIPEHVPNHISISLFILFLELCSFFL